MTDHSGEMNTTISPNDRMYRANRDYYFAAGEFALRCIEQALEVTRRQAVTRILDLPCGHGRILRHLAARFPHSELIACDVLRDGVDFCSKTFGAIPVYSVEDPEQISIPGGPVDLIWSGSLLTHVPEQQVRAFLRRFEVALPPGGVVVFTTYGRLCVEQRLRRRRMPFELSEAEIEGLLAQYDETGFGYCDNLSRADSSAFPTSFGTTVASPAWLCRALDEETNLQLALYLEGGWGSDRNEWSQDAIACSTPV